MYSVAREADGLSLKRLGSIPCKAVVTAASGPKGVVYYVPEEEPTSILQWSAADQSSKEFVKVPVAIKKLLFYRNKVYCGPVHGTCLTCVDPLNHCTEQLDTHHSIVDFEAADHGFVVENDEGMLFGHHFNCGSCKAHDTGNAQLLGHYKRFGVAMSLGKSGPIGVNEKGEVAHPPSIPSGLTASFVCAGDVVFVYKKGTRTIETVDETAKCPLPNDLMSEGIASITPVREDDDDDDDVCTLCFCEFEGDGDGITLDCGHRFHRDCVLEWASRWDSFKAEGNHIVFTYAVCPGGCKHLVRHPLLGAVSESINTMFDKVMQQSKAILQSMPATKLEDDLLFYVCSKCGNPFYGGEKTCFRAQGGEPTKDPADLLCESCQTDFICPKHARGFVVYKCRYCCNPATERSFGNRYFCDRCSARWLATAEPDPLPCPGKGQCPLHGSGHPEGTYPIGCLVCLSEGSLDYDMIVPAPAKESSAAAA